MKRHPLCLAAGILLLGAASGALAADGGENLFNGKDLAGWEGDPAFWKVEDGAITGESSKAVPCGKTTFLILKDRKVGDFELTVRFRFLSDWGNSGVQYRSTVADAKAFDVKGYQADFETGPNHTGILYEQGGRGILVKRGDKMEITAAGARQVTGHFEAAKILQLEKGRWHTQRIVAKGSHLIQEIDGVRTMEVADNDSKRSARQGCLALQLHSGPAMKVQFKEIVLKEIPQKEAKATEVPKKQDK